MGGADERPATERLLRERAPRLDVGRRAGSVRRLLRHDGWPGVRVPRRRRQLVGDRARSARGAVGRGADALMIRVVLPPPLRILAKTGAEITVNVTGPVTQRSVLDAVEHGYPMLRGTLRDYETQRRRPLVRFFACEEDLSSEPPDAPPPAEVASGKEPFLVIGAIAGG